MSGLTLKKIQIEINKFQNGKKFNEVDALQKFISHTAEAVAKLTDDANTKQNVTRSVTLPLIQ